MFWQCTLEFDNCSGGWQEEWRPGFAKEQQELPHPVDEDEMDESEEAEMIYQSVNKPLLANECAISRLERKIVMEPVFVDPDTNEREDGNKKRSRMMA